MLTAIIDYESGNLHSAHKAFERMAREADAGEVVVTADADVIAGADRIVLPGDGAFPACMAALKGKSGIYAAMIAVSAWADIFAKREEFEEEVCSSTRPRVAARATLSCAAPRRRSRAHGRRPG